MNIDKIPNGPHYAVLVVNQVYHEGDELSRTAPGHGYPAHTEETVGYIPFLNELDRDDWILKNEAGAKKKFILIRAEPHRINVRTVVDVEPFYDD